MSRVILPLIVLLLVILTDSSGLATSVNYDIVEVVVFNEVSHIKAPIEGFSYPPLGQGYPKLCKINIYSNFHSSPEDCYTLLPQFEDCTVVYYEEECSTNLIDLVQQVKERGGAAVIYRTDHKRDHLIETLHDHSIDITVILVKDIEIRSFGHELISYVNITFKRQGTSTPPGPKDGLGQRSTTTFYFVVFAFTILLLLSLTWFIFNYLRRCHHMYTTKRRRVRN